MQKSLTCAGLTALLAMSISSCTTKEPGQFDYIVDNFADIQVLRYKVPEFDSLSLQQKQPLAGATFYGTKTANTT